MLTIIMHNSRDYIFTLNALIKREFAVDTNIVSFKDIGRCIPGERFIPQYSSSNISEHYDNALLVMTGNTLKIHKIKELINDHPSLRWLNFKTSGFICTLPYGKIEDCNRQSLRRKKGEPKMKLEQYINSGCMLLDIRSRSKEDAIRETASLLKNSPAITDFEQFIADVFAREALQTTGIGDGVAIPHARTDTTTDFVIAFGRSQEGIDFGAPDGAPVKLIFLMGTPKKDGLSDYLKMLAHLSRLLKRGSFRDFMLTAQDPDEIVRELARSDS